MTIKKLWAVALASMCAAAGAQAETASVSGPDGRLSVNVATDAEGCPYYTVDYDGKSILTKSPLGFTTNFGDFTKGYTVSGLSRDTLARSYRQDKIKKERIDYRANVMKVGFEKGAAGKKLPFEVEFRVSDNDVAFRYLIPRQGETGSAVMESEATGFGFPQGTTVWMTHQSDPMIGWKRTKPSYEEYYINDAELGTKSQYGHGFTFPALFKAGENGWALVTESGVDGYYCASHLSDYDGSCYRVAYPMAGENNGNGSASPGIALPGSTPWRIITVGRDLAPIVETTAPWDVVEPRYSALRDARPGKGTWSWIVWQDASMNYDDQVTFIDLAKELGYDNILIDAFWDTGVGRERMPELLGYARSQGVNPILWYSSSGHWNDITQSPINRMDRPIVRKAEMKWLRDMGVKAIKVDFFGGDKQETMRLYEDILSDAADYGIDVIFHGCTLPRGWERMYPNFVGAEAVLASENLIFEQSFCDKEAYHATLHPFIRNAVAVMEYGGTILNKRLGRGGKSGNVRKTTDAFQLATSVLFQNPVQNFGLTPEALESAPKEAIDFMKEVPTTWSDTRYIAGYPGRYAVVARRAKDSGKWYIAGVNATDKAVEVSIDPAMLGLTAPMVTVYDDEPRSRELRKRFEAVPKKGKPMKLGIAPDGGAFVVIAE